LIVLLAARLERQGESKLRRVTVQMAPFSEMLCSWQSKEKGQIVHVDSQATTERISEISVPSAWAVALSVIPRGVVYWSCSVPAMVKEDLVFYAIR
jgi:hypothetical protein